MKAADRLNSLIGGRLASDAKVDRRSEGTHPAPGVLHVAISRVEADPNQPRKTFDEEGLRELADSLKTHGQLQPIRVRWDAAAEKWIVIAGERRLRAATLAGLQTIMAIADEEPHSESELVVIQLVENAARADLSPLEAAHAYRGLLDALGCTQAELALRLAISTSKVSRTLALLNLPGEVQQKIATRKTGAVATVMKARRKKPARSMRLATEAGVVVVSPKKGATVEQVLAAALEAVRARGAKAA